MYRITQERLKELLIYDADNGIFIWNVCRRGYAKKGTTAGSINKKGYIKITIDGVQCYSHRLAFLYMTGNLPKEVDHINHNRQDNRWVNLRSVTRQANSKNLSISKINKSGVIGISWDKKRNKWVAQISVCGKTKNLGRYDDFEDAIKIRKQAEFQYNFHPNHGDHFVST